MFFKNDVKCRLSGGPKMRKNDIFSIWYPVHKTRWNQTNFLGGSQSKDQTTLWYHPQTHAFSLFRVHVIEKMGTHNWSQKSIMGKNRLLGEWPQLNKEMPWNFVSQHSYRSKDHIKRLDVNIGPKPKIKTRTVRFSKIKPTIDFLP